MKPYSTRGSEAAVNRPTNLHELVADVCHALTPTMARHQVICQLDVDRGIEFPLAASRVRAALVQLLYEALEAMPTGGQIDVIAVVGPQGLEIEVADSGADPGDSCGLRLYDATERRQRQTSWRAGLQIETLDCPQGGTARTLLVPWPALRAAA